MSINMTRSIKISSGRSNMIKLSNDLNYKGRKAQLE
jgi:hypothetical protein